MREEGKRRKEEEEEEEEENEGGGIYEHVRLQPKRHNCHVVEFVKKLLQLIV